MYIKNNHVIARRLFTDAGFLKTTTLATVTPDMLRRTWKYWTSVIPHPMWGLGGILGKTALHTTLWQNCGT